MTSITASTFVPTATTSVVGKIQIAADSVVRSGSNTTQALTPANMKKHPAAAAAWVNFNGTGTVAIRSSFNVTSITDNGVGAYTANFDTPMANNNYCALASSNESSGYLNSNNISSTEATARPYNLLPTSCSITTQFHVGTIAQNNKDVGLATLAIFGEN